MKIIEDTDAFKVFTEEIEFQEGYKRPLGFGLCRVDHGQMNHEKILQATYPVANWGKNFGSAAIFIAALQEQGIEIDFNADEVICEINDQVIENCMNAFHPYIETAIGQEHTNVQTIMSLSFALEAEQMISNAELISNIDITTDEFCLNNEELKDSYRICFIFNDAPLKSVEASYLKLYAISNGDADIRSLNLNGAFGQLPNVAWSNGKPIELDWLRENQIQLKLEDEYPHIDFVDKFPRFLQHIIPADNTRILETSKVRFGAQLAAGTTVMPGASYINFNSGTTGSVMVEGRISSSAIVNDGSDVGGGASILGVLSGTDGNPISVGKNCLLGANSVCGIPLGNACIIDAGLAILEGTKIDIDHDELKLIESANNLNFKIVGGIYKAKDLAYLNGIHFRQNSLTGQIHAFRSNRKVVLNADLH